MNARAAWRKLISGLERDIKVAHPDLRKHLEVSLEYVKGAHGHAGHYDLPTLNLDAAGGDVYLALADALDAEGKRLKHKENQGARWAAGILRRAQSNRVSALGKCTSGELEALIKARDEEGETLEDHIERMTRRTIRGGG